MLHIATVHAGTPHWIPIQLRELRRHVSTPYRTWASLEGIEAEHGKGFDRVLEPVDGGAEAGRGTGPVDRHVRQLNHLAAQVCGQASDTDLLMFLDGDAFPVRDPEPLVSTGMATAPLMAVRRDENVNEPQPHPCFCITRVQTWRELPGDWSPGPGWSAPDGGRTSDPGGCLLQRLQRTATPWTPVLRTNRRNPHPLFFGVYGDVIYHHGAGFRLPISRVDLASLGSSRDAGEMAHTGKAHELAAANLRQSKAIFARIEHDDPKWLDELI